MDFTEGSRGIYRPIRVLFDTPIYERALQTCWHIGSYKSQIALVAELLRLQQKYQLSSEVTAEDMTDLLLEESKSTVRVKLWEFELEDFDEDVIPLLRLVWEVNNNMKSRDVEFEARRLLNSPETIPPQFQHPKIISQAHKYAKSLTEQHQQIPSSKLLRPREVVMEVVPKVVQGFWLPPPNTFFNMPSKQLSKMAVGVTKAVEDRVSTTLSSMLLQVSFSHSVRDDMVLSIQEKVRQGYTKDVLVKMLNCFSAKVLKTISDVAAAEICELFQPQTRTKVPPNLKPREDCTQPADVVDRAEAKTSSAVITPPPAPLTLATAPANTGLDEAEEQSMPNSEPDFAVVPAPPLPLTPAAQPSVTASVLQSSIPSSEPDSAVATTPVITAAQDDQTASAEPSDNFIVHNGFNNSLDNTEEEPTSSPQPDPSVLSPPPAPLTLATTPANTGLDEAEEQPVPSSEPDSAVATTPPTPVITTVLNLLTTLLSTMVLRTPWTTQRKSQLQAHTSLDEAEEQPVPSSEPDSAVVTTLPPPVSPADNSPVISAAQDDQTTSAESPDNFIVHNGLNDSLDNTEEEPTSNPQPDSSALSPPPAPLTLSTTPANTGLNEAEEQSMPNSEPDFAVVPAPPLPLTPAAQPSVTASVLDGENMSEEPTREPDSAMGPAQPAPLTLSDKPPIITAAQDDQTTSAEPPDNFIVHNGFNNSLDNTEEEPTSSPQPDSSVLSPPPAPLTLATTPANTGLDEAEEQSLPSSEPDSAVATTPPTPVITTVQDDQTASAEPPDNFIVHNGFNNSLDNTEEEPTSSPQPDFSALSPPSAPLTLITETPANTGLDEAEQQQVLSTEPDSAVATTPAPPVSPADESPVISAVQNDQTTSAEPPDNFVVHNGLNKSLDEAEEEPTSSPKPDSSALSPQQQVLSTEPDSAVATTPARPVSPADESPVISAVQDDLTASAEPPSNSAIHNGLNNSLDEAEEEPTSSPKPDSSALSPPPAPLTFATETPANTGLDEAEEQPVLSTESAVIPPPPAPLTPSPEPPANAANTPNTQGPTFSPEPDSTFVTAPPPPVTPPADESPAISAVQDDLIIMQQPVRVDESFTTTTEVKKTKRRRFSCFVGWLRKNICCCFLSEDTEAE